ncbi:Potassium channel subfamily K member 1 [Acipenser ruthenus]|uniref:Potassium channel subfamily K member 1 n=1 Tax=Acipenser ruthenus TaxID=7906 RepID=A0A444UJD1_ACIRT|nr:Potassium channel subfamily K member 1 [Acipenser ruthenus]
MSSNSRAGIVVLFFFVFYLIYLILGAVIFSIIEGPEEIRLKDELRILKANFLNHSCVNSSSLETFLEQVLTASKYGVSVLNNASVNTNWDFASSLFFASTLVTTVVYLFVGLMAMLLVLRSFHKVCDLHGLTSLFQLPKCEEEEEEEEDQEPIIEPDQPQKQLTAGVQPSYNSINR